MTRPETHDDLSEYDRSGHTVAKVYSDSLIQHPSLGQILLAALAEAERLGLAIKDGEITIPLATDELDEKLSRAQRVWDSYAKTYDDLEAGCDVDLPEWRRGLFAEWVKGEGLPEIEFGVDLVAVLR